LGKGSSVRGGGKRVVHRGQSGGQREIVNAAEKKVRPRWFVLR